LVDLIIIGSGPYGISLAAHAAAHQLSYVLLGEPMHFWQRQMPQSMFIRTHPASIQLSDLHENYTLEHFAEETGRTIAYPLPRPVFVQYAFWFAERTGVRFTPDLAVRLSRTPGGYTVQTRQGQQLSARHAVVATGLQHYKYVPEVLRGLPSALLSHTFGLTDFTRFSARQIAVLGSGQSAWEAAALLHQAGSEVELLYRREAPNYREGNSGAELIALSEAFYAWPADKKRERWAQQAGSVAEFLRPLVEGKAKETPGIRIDRAEAAAAGRLKLSLSNGEERIVDHLIAATGYRIDVDKVPFIEPGLAAAIERESDETAAYPAYPRLNEWFESSEPGLYFAGPLASRSHGPAFRFIAGLRKTCLSIIPRIAGTRVPR